MSTLLIISALGTDRPGLVNDLSKSIADCGCNIQDSRMTVLGGEFALMILSAGHWGAIAKLEDALPGLQKRLDLTLISRRTQERATPGNAMPYSVEVIALDNPGIVSELARFFSSRQINIHDMYTGSYAAAHTGTPMFSVNLTIEIPADTHLSSLREQFLDFCDALNLDAVMEPIKG